MVRLAYRALGREHTLLITDSMEGTGCPDGKYSIAGQTVLLKNGRACTEDGSLAGSTLSLIDAVRNLCEVCRVPLEDAILCASRNPARLIGMQDAVGSLDVGCYADLLVLHAHEPTLLEVWLGGNRITEGAI
jgi:N-acetylglucosamine-6-phosphate deacetylase